MRRRWLFLLLVIVVCMITSGCSSSKTSGDGGGTTLTFYSTATSEEDKKVMSEAVAAFEEKYPEIDIEDNYPGDGYEDMLRVKMAANDLPDLFDTHGWAKQRYGEYVADLSEMDWVKNLDPALDTILKDDEGKVYAYPLNQAKDGISYNAGLLDEYGIEPPTTFEGFMKALEKIKEKSNGEVTPFWFNGSDKSAFGQYFDQFATPLLVTDKEHKYEEELLNGTFDWSHYTFLPEKLKEMQEKGLLNKDALTAQIQQQTQLMAQGKIGFTLASGSLGPSVEKLNPEVQVGVIPMPTIHEGDEPSWIGGERHTVAIWKETEHMEEAQKFIEFLAQPEVAKKIAEGTSLPAGLKDIDAENYYSEYYKKYEGVKVQPYFDRVYLPSGMWNVMGSTGQQLLSGKMTPAGVSEKMAEEYKRLKE
ncbi:extracellular solute-binding protein [Halobacillus shinanisalinarum]|uniref:Extracellular solute-binding protein n=1 Tax=Halobacillus shinanisalinarum TaxID=2932258 RepID=A0ABY4H2U1_9BACI|nr:extracellular solute-binding protein [Halobacillus shinanisalinarum]UOQ94506.1 extracellular solute-binding protein [Halobacillus shinanisalinarum]